jgi:hypothetical protein
MKTHLLRCSKLNKIAVANDEANTLLRSHQNCLWGTCSTPFNEGQCENAERAASHISHHLSDSSTCLWDGCLQSYKDVIGLHIHLEEDHGIMSELTLPNKPHFCFQCATWTMSDLDWYFHGIHHARNPSIHCGLVTVNGILAAPGRCPFCMAKGIFRQYESMTPYLEHVSKHIDKEEEVSLYLKCPHAECDTEEMCAAELRHHLEEVHSIALSALD